MAPHLRDQLGVLFGDRAGVAKRLSKPRCAGGKRISTRHPACDAIDALPSCDAISKALAQRAIALVCWVGQSAVLARLVVKEPSE